MTTWSKLDTFQVIHLSTSQKRQTKTKNYVRTWLNYLIFSFSEFGEWILKVKEFFEKKNKKGVPPEQKSFNENNKKIRIFSRHRRPC